MATIQIRDLPDEVAEVFRRRSEAAGMSLQAYMRRELIAAAERRTKAEAIAAIRESLDRDAGPGADRDSILSALHDARGE
ncbi:antitoxin [Nocardia sp. NPDC058705]|uniref:FitA-like ribbon-helix-helix domain-containing protein n=1 Tax=Nocardia sp. NPDC058705 TaxID=3346609 RepID=UPI0036AC6113